MKQKKREIGIIEGYRFLMPYAAKHKRSFAMFFLGWMIEAFCTLIIPPLYGVLIDEMVYYKNIDVFFKISGIIIMVSLFLSTIYFITYDFFNRITGKFTRDIRLDLFDHFTRLPAYQVASSKAGDIINTIQSYASQCALMITRNAIYTVYQASKIVFFSFYIFLTNWQIGTLMFVMAPISAYLTLKAGKKIRKSSEKRKSVYGMYLGWMMEILNGIRDIRFLGAEKRTEKRFKDDNRNLFKLDNKIKTFAVSMNNLVDFVNLLMQLVIFGFSAYFVAGGDMTLGSFVVINMFWQDLKYSIYCLNGYYVDLQDRLSYVKYIRDFKRQPVEDTSKKPDINIQLGEVQFQNVSFAYGENRTILSAINLHIHSGETIAIVGESGCGKSTLASMLVGLVTPTSGTITIDGQLIADHSLYSLRKNIGYVQQQDHLFIGTIYDNVLVGNLKASKEKVRKACEQAGVLDFADALEKGLETMIGADGCDLSAGQKQRIAIARICLQNPPIIIFDESTSSLDSETSVTIHKLWKETFSDKTLIVITHKFSDIENCDRVAYMQDAKILFADEVDAAITTEEFQHLFHKQKDSVSNSEDTAV